MTDLDPYPVDPTNRLHVSRLRSAAKAGDKRAAATIAQLEQQRHEKTWQAAEDASAKAEQERQARHANRPTSIAATRDQRQRQRDERAAAAQADREAAAEAIARRKSMYGW